MIGSRNNPGEAHENGSIEAHNKHLKTALDQALILRGSRDFADLAASRRFVDEIVARRNRRREDRVRVELQTLRPLPERRTTDCSETVVRMLFPKEHVNPRSSKPLLSGSCPRYRFT